MTTSSSSCLHRPAVSSDGGHLAVITPDYALRILSVDESDCSIVDHYLLPKSWHSFLSKLTFLKWAPSDWHHGCNTNTSRLPYLLLTDGNRLVVVNPNTVPKAATSVSNASNTVSYVVADYNLGGQFGKLTYADFILDQFHVLLLYEMAAHASILSLMSPRREDIASIKFAGEQGVSVSPSGRTQALLLRTKGQDHVVVLARVANEIEIQSTFATHTIDAQGIAWSPNGDPVIIVWDAASHGARISFFTALGHPLKQLDIEPSPTDHILAGVGVSDVQLVTHDEGVIIAFAHGEKELVLRYQHHKTMTTRPLISLKHPNVIDGAQAIVWQQVNQREQTFHLEKGAFDAVSDSATEPAPTRISFNANQSFLATTVADNARTIRLWQPEHPDVHTVIVFSHIVRQVAWHPRNPGVLIIVTAQKEPAVYVWYAETKAPAQCVLPLDNIGSAKLEVEWLVREGQHRCPLLVRAGNFWKLGLLELRPGGILFECILQPHPFGLADNDLTEELYTPSRTSKTKEIPSKFEKSASRDAKSKSNLW